MNWWSNKTAMSKYALKIKTEETGTKVISILRKFDPSLSIAEIRKRMQEDDFVVKYDSSNTTCSIGM